MRVILHIDMDAFYASVEQRDNPALRGRPVIVGADPQEGRGRGVVCAASYEARKFGVRSAQPISRAYKCCPHGIYLPVRMKRYAEISRQLMNIFSDYTPLVQAVSLDEAFLDMSGSGRLFRSCRDTGIEIKKRILSELELTASVGMAPNKLLAKIASDFDKPDGFTVIEPEEAETFLAPLPVSCLWGVGSKTAIRLQALGIRSVGDIKKIPETYLTSIFGKQGAQLLQYARGIDHSRVIPERNAKSISNEVTFRKDESDQSIIHDTILQLSEKVGFRLRQAGLSAGSVSIKIRFSDFRTIVRTRTPGSDIRLDQEIREQVLDLFRRIEPGGQSIRLVGIGVGSLTENKMRQISLFTETDRRSQDLSDTLDMIKQKYGNNAISRGTCY